MLCFGPRQIRGGEGGGGGGLGVEVAFPIGFSSLQRLFFVLPKIRGEGPGLSG